MAGKQLEGGHCKQSTEQTYLILGAGFLNWINGWRTLRGWDPFALRSGLGPWWFMALGPNMGSTLSLAK